MASVDTPDDQLLSVNYGDIEADDWAAKHQISLAEHASRLDSRHHFDNRGRVVWTNGFENLLVKWNSATGGGGTVARAVTAAWRGNASLRMAVGAAAIDMAQIYKYFYSPLTNRYGFELAWSCSSASITEMIFYLDVYDGAFLNRAQLRYTNAAGQWQYLDAAGVNQNIGAAPILRGDIHYWHKLKIVVDSTLLEWDRVLLDGQEISMVGTGLRQFAMAAGPYINLMVEITGSALGAFALHIDDVILTHLEP